MNDKQRTWIWAIALGIFLVFYRQLPYYLPTTWSWAWNLAPAAAFALFTGVRLRDGWMGLAPLVAYFISDILLIIPLSRFDPPLSAFSLATPLIYLCLVATVGLGRVLKRDESSPLVLGGMTLLGSVLFFVVTNFSAWLVDHDYPRTLNGLGQCYFKGLPFFRNTVAGDLLFTGVFFGLYALAGRTHTLTARQPA